ncbi:MAG: hypothetical protein J7K40_14700 [candidate division Zixibacteria bacterium]|nr:hypothetical protein [candidate division Zixibacteria bacterium]
MSRIVIPILLAIILMGCVKEEIIEIPDVPFPADEDMVFYQAESDSGYQDFWTDIKAVSSAFLNNSKYWDMKIKSENIVILGEGLFHGTVEIESSELILTLKMERKFKSKGRNAIWQVIAVKEKSWPLQDSTSGQ